LRWKARSRNPKRRSILLMQEEVIKSWRKK
jgi:hypothetical protein